MFYDEIIRCAIRMSQITDDINNDCVHLRKKSPISICSNRSANEISALDQR